MHLPTAKVIAAVVNRKVRLTMRPFSKPIGLPRKEAMHPWVP